MNQVYLALGSNIRAEFNLAQAVRLLAGCGEIRQKSSVWQSQPVGDENQADFLNAAVLLETECDAQRIWDEVIPGIEARLLRVRDPLNKNGPRTIDVDLALFNEEQLQIAHRIVPDPDIGNRVFLAVPLAELAPGYCVPGLGRPLSVIAAELQANEGSEFFRRDDVQL
ncbi:2-amino-4-hydroxy-6-hydroxymethyldihydropteridine diphosphokinase [Gimesia algae]|uniref:2-amino-4-hydroxy-6-hydroxymethyldihydropteridine pyrophosphokinase n=1 Tax=Gimesia algae TaxID=2527971 RepID=A0A517V7S4_9PLAN|nr:2-amino-4-hydroxy-6-hydroxymethyldihydropteridine diphosphokinase [Gimesia algae]QDT89058.1 2-amino-4-hydroxy-6-hydroxymethyldihydropteridine pyrophosphokinase [Gimesia algae]